MNLNFKNLIQLKEEVFVICVIPLLEERETVVRWFELNFLSTLLFSALRPLSSRRGKRLGGLN